MIRRPPRSTRTDTPFPTRRSSDLHSVVENPCSAMYMGRNTGKANCAVVLMIRTIPPSKTLGSSRMIVRPFASSSIFEEAPVDADGNLDRSEEHTSELQSLMRISYAVFCLKKKQKKNTTKYK